MAKINQIKSQLEEEEIRGVEMDNRLLRRLLQILSTPTKDLIDPKKHE